MDIDKNTTQEFSKKPEKGGVWDVVIIGSGPASFAASIYTTRGAASTLILGGEKWGGQLMLTTEIDNYPALPGIQGPELMQKLKEHAVMFGGEFIPKNVENIEVSKMPFELSVTGGEKFLAKAIIVATGAETIWLGIPGEETLRGRGVSSCAPCDAPFFKEKNVIVVGGGDSAMEEALVLTKYATSVTMVHRKDKFKASVAMQNKIFALEKTGKIKILWNSEMKEFIGTQKLEKVKIFNNSTNQESEMSIDGAFVAIGHKPSTKIFSGKLELDERGFVIKKDGAKTNVKGVFVAGDVHDHVYKQAATASGFGVMAGMDALKFLDEPKTLKTQG